MENRADRPRKKKGYGLVRRLGTWAVMVLLLGSLAFCRPSLGGQVTMDIQYGYGNMAKGDRHLPVEVTLGNPKDAPLDATLINSLLIKCGYVFTNITI